MERNKCSKWTIEEEEQLILEFLKGKSREELSIILGRSIGAIVSRLKAIGLIENHSFYKKDDIKFKNLVKRG